ncbi:MAG: dihydroneopterin aldolase [Methylotenera sp.]|nr:dihydroneopterin aldolase [Methylotenera sp.]
MDRICICNLYIRCILGLNQEERREKQDVVINLTIYTDLRAAGKSDQLEDTVDYRALKKRILVMVEDSHYYLAEALAEAVASLCLDHPRVARVDVRLDKPHALRFAQSVAVEITREH